MSVGAMEFDSMIYPGSDYTLYWNNSELSSIRFEVDNNGWTDEISGHHFLSVLVDPHINHYTWNVPLYLSQYWHKSSRFVFTNLETDQRYYTSNTTISGLDFTPVNYWTENIIRSGTRINISWLTNNQQPYDLSLYNEGTNYFNLDIREPLYNIGRSLSTYYNWLIPDNISTLDTDVVIVAESVDQKTYGVSDGFTIYSPTTSPTTTPTTSPTSSPTSTPTTSPTSTPTTSPTSTPTTSPTSSPTSTSPTSSPTSTPTTSPTTIPTTSPTTTPTISTPNSNSTEIDRGHIVWIIPVSIIGLLIILMCIYCFCKNKDKPNQIAPVRDWGYNNPVYDTKSNSGNNRIHNNQIYGTRC